MMSYTMQCTSLCDSAGMLMRFMSPSTRIIGGTPEDRCRSEALFLTANARSCAISTAMRMLAVQDPPQAQYSGGASILQYVNGSAELASR